MSSSDMIAVNTPPPVPFLPPQPPAPRSGSQGHSSRQHRRGGYVPPSSTAENVSSLIMGLSPAPPQPKADTPWGRGRRGRGSSPWRVEALPQQPQPPHSKAALFERSNRSSSVLSGDKHSARGTSPHSARGPNSSNWRSSSSASSMTGTTFTRFSNSSMRSVSTVATSVSAASSWRNPNPPVKDKDKDKDDSSTSSSTTSPRLNKKVKPPLPPPPANLKIITGVPWELGELPRGLHGRPNDHTFSPPPVRYAIKAQKAAGSGSPLDTINERERGAIPKSPVYQRGDAAHSTSDVCDTDCPSDGPKKVQKGQINTLAKMLSALKANRGAH